MRLPTVWISGGRCEWVTRSQPAIPTFVRQALRGEPLTVAGDGSQTRSVCFVDALPLNATGKVDKAALEAKALEPGP